MSFPPPGLEPMPCTAASIANVINHDNWFKNESRSCARRESNPGHKHGRLVWCRYTTCAMSRRHVLLFTCVLTHHSNNTQTVSDICRGIDLLGFCALFRPTGVFEFLSFWVLQILMFWFLPVDWIIWFFEFLSFWVFEFLFVSYGFRNLVQGFLDFCAFVWLSHIITGISRGIPTPARDTHPQSQKPRNSKTKKLKHSRKQMKSSRNRDIYIYIYITVPHSYPLLLQSSIYLLNSNLRKPIYLDLYLESRSGFKI